MRRAIAADLDADVAEAAFAQLGYAVLELLHVTTAGMAVTIHGEAALAAEELIDRHAGALALDVPQGLIYSAERVVQHRTVAPVGTRVGGLPEILDIVGISTAAEVVKVILDRAFHR